MSCHSVCCLALLEPRVSASKLPGILKSTGFDESYVVEAQGFSGGIWLLWNKQWGAIEVLSSTRQLVHTRLTLQRGVQPLLVTFVYGSPNASARDTLWRDLRTIATTVNEPWAVVGDFNAYLNASDKVGGGSPNYHSMDKFRSCVEDCSISDLGFKGPPFTWEGRGVKERIDWALGTEQWVRSVPEATIMHLPKLKSDHKPILMKLFNDPGDHSQRPFRFVASWLTHADFPRVVDEAWRAHDTWDPSSAAFRNTVTTWNTEVFGEIGRRKRRLMRRMEGINIRLRMAHNPYLERLQKWLWEDYHKALIQEELLWKQKSRESWLNHEDKNTRYFHTTTMVRRKRNKIEALSDDDGNLVTDPETLKAMAVNYFRSLYAHSEGGSPYNTGLTFPRLSSETIHNIVRPLDAEEIKNAVFGMGALKAPGPDGLNPLFFQSQWNIVGN